MSTTALICGTIALFSPAGAAVGVAAMVFGFASAALKCVDSTRSECEQGMFMEAIAPFVGPAGGLAARFIRASTKTEEAAEWVANASLNVYSVMVQKRDWDSLASRW